MKLSDITSINEILDNMYKSIKTKSNSDKSFVNFPQLPTELSKLLNFESSALPSEELEELKTLLGQQTKSLNPEKLKSQIIMFNELIEHYKRAKLLSTYYSDSFNSSDEIIEYSITKRKELFVIFSDIRNFTTISEALEADEVGFFLTQYFSRVFSLAKSLGMKIDKIIGDAYLALSDSERSVAWFVSQINHVIVKFNEYFQSNPSKKHEEINFKLQTKIGSPKGLVVRAGMGIHFGSLIKGDIGSNERADHTVIGDTVNVAARLEGLTKNFMDESDNSLILYSSDVIQKIIPWLQSKIKTLEKTDQFWRDHLASIKDIREPINDAYVEELRLMHICEQKISSLREVIGFYLKGKKQLIRVFTDKPFDKDLQPLIKIYHESIKRYHMGGNSLFLSYQQLCSIHEKVPDDKIVVKSLEALSESLCEYFFEISKQKLKRDPTALQKAYTQGVINMKFGNSHKAIANFMDFLNYNYHDSLKEIKQYTDQYIDVLVGYVNRLNEENAIALSADFTESYEILENLVSSKLQLISEVPGYNEFFEKLTNKITEWTNFVVQIKGHYPNRLKLISIIILYNRILHQYTDEQRLYHVVISEWEEELLKLSENHEDVSKLNCKEVFNAIKKARYNVQDKTRQVAKFQLFATI